MCLMPNVDDAFAEKICFLFSAGYIYLYITLNLYLYTQMQSLPHAYADINVLLKAGYRNS